VGADCVEGLWVVGNVAYFHFRLPAPWMPGWVPVWMTGVDDEMSFHPVAQRTREQRCLVEYTPMKVPVKSQGSAPGVGNVSPYGPITTE